MNDALYDVAQVASALVGIYAKVSPLVYLIRAFALNLGPSLQSKALVLRFSDKRSTKTKFNVGGTA